ncbi:MAG: GGDEF domain-containing protein [Micavibrio sp.]
MIQDTVPHNRQHGASGHALPAPAVRTKARGLARSAPYAAEQRELERDGWWRTISATLSFLRWAHKRLEEAEDKIREQEGRILALQEQITIDDLTGLLNRRGFTDAFTREIDRASRGYGQGGLLILIDLDNFKMINDTYGHAAGDAALRLVGKTLLGNSRKMDSCARIGGDEFVLLLANTERDKALVRAQNLIKQLNSLSLVWYGAEIPVRASLGLKDYTEGDTPEDVFGAADTKLYAEKRRNKGIYDWSYRSAI